MFFDKEMLVILAVSAVSGGLFYLVASLRFGVHKLRKAGGSQSVGQ
jgi:hypothetical protein